MPKHNGFADKMRRAIADRLLPSRHTTLLVVIVALLGVRPLIGDSGAATAVFSVVVMLVFVVVLYTIEVDELLGDRERLIQQRKHRGIFGWVLALIAIALRVADIVSPNHQLATASSITLLLFFGFVALTELRAVLRQRAITRETISMSILQSSMRAIECFSASDLPLFSPRQIRKRPARANGRPDPQLRLSHRGNGCSEY